jgi:hypothetical protein
MKMYPGGNLQDPPRDTIPTNPLYPTLDLPDMGSGNVSYPPNPIVTPQMNMEEGAPGQFPIPEAFTIPLNPLDPTNAAGRTVPTQSVAPTVSQAELEAATSGQEALPQPGSQGQTRTGTPSTRRSTTSNIGQSPFSSADEMKLFQRYAGLTDDGI